MEKVCITPGNYATAEDLINEINYDISQCCADLSGLKLTYSNPNVNNKLLYFLNMTSYTIKIIFWPPPTIDCSGCQLNIEGCTQNLTYTQNLGYYLGYRITRSNSTTLETLILKSIINPLLSHLIAEYLNALESNDSEINNDTYKIAHQIITFLKNDSSFYQQTDNGFQFAGEAVTPVNLNKTEYILFILDDYNKNYPSNGSISIAPKNTRLDLPTYAINLGEDFSSNICVNKVCSLLGLSSECTFADTSIGQNKTLYVPTYPRKLTQAQIYSVNQILYNRDKPNDSIIAPNNSNLFATIYPQHNKNNTFYQNQNIVYERKYFGPTRIERLGVKLIDDKGNILNLHGSDWSFTLAAEQLYQY